MNHRCYINNKKELKDMVKQPPEILVLVDMYGIYLKLKGYKRWRGQCRPCYS